MKKHGNILKSIIISCLLLSSTFAEDTTEVKPYRAKDISQQILAKVGSINITADEFLNGYEFGPAFIKRQKDSKKKYLDFMIYEKLLAQEAYNKKLDESEDVNQFLNEIKNDLATEQLYRDSIWNHIKVNENEIKLAADKDNIEFELKWIFKPTMEEIKEQINLLRNGIAFDSLFTLQFKDSVQYNDRYLKTTRFKLEKTNPVLATVIDSLKIGEPSIPIKTEDGFYIVKIVNLWRNVINTETEMNDKFYSMEEYLRKQKADSASDVYVNKILSAENPIIVRLTFNILKSYLGKKYLTPQQYSEWQMEKNIIPFIKDFNPKDINSYLQHTLIRMNNDSLCLNDFLVWFTNREPYIRFNLKSHQEFNISLQNIVWRMLRDTKLARIAARNNYLNHPDVLRQMKWWKDKIVYSKLKLELAKSIRLDEQKVHSYYDEHKKDYITTHEKENSFENVKEQVWNDCYVYEYTKKVVNQVLQLKSKYNITIDESILNQLNVNDENNPKAIDMYTVKKGGTFVRPVYPSIDYEWQFWN